MDKLSILCIDDEDIVVQSLENELSKQFGNQYDLEFAIDTEDALEIIQDIQNEGGELAVVVSDYIMPKMRGDDFLIRVHQKVPKTKKIMLTGQSRIEGVTKVINQANLYRYLEKPWEPQDLVLTISEALKAYKAEKLLIQKNQELSILNSSLEKQVEERTSELENTYVKLIELERFKDRMIGMVAHDMKNPLNSIISLAGPASEIGNAGNHILTMVMNLLDIQKFESTNMQLNKALYDFCKVVRTALKQVQLLIEKKNHTLYLHLPSKLEGVFDWDLVLRIVINLLTNAIKHTPNNGKISVSLNHINGIAELIIEDNGEGITKEDLPLIFNQYFQASTRRSGRVQSTGLGLTFCRMATEAHDGHIKAESIETKGTIFTVHLPTGLQIDPQPIDSTHTEEVRTQHPFLSDEAKNIVAQYLPMFQELDIYETSKLLGILQKINDEGHPELTPWIKAMENAIFTCNPHDYQSLISYTHS